MMMKSKYNKFSVLSNLTFLVPLSIAYMQNKDSYVYLLATVIIVSTIYHLNEKNNFVHHVDNLLAFLLVSFNTYLLFSSPNWLTFLIPILILSVLALFRVVIRRKDDWLWHTLSSAICVLCLWA